MIRRLLTHTAIVALTSALLAGTAQASQITLDFNGASSDDPTSYTEGGYTFTAMWGPGGPPTSGLPPILDLVATGNCSPSCADDGTMTLGTILYLQHDFIRLTANDNSAFRITSFLGGEAISGAAPAWANEIRMTGRRADNSTVTQDFTLDHINDGTGGLVDFQQFMASSFFDVFVEIDISGIGNSGTYLLDNIVIDTEAAAVPEPASLTLFGTGLLFAARRLRRSPKNG